MNLQMLFLKKIVEKKTRLICTIIMYTLCAFLILLFFTMSLNTNESTEKMYANEYRNKIVFVEETNKREDIGEILDKYSLKYSIMSCENVSVTNLGSHKICADVYGNTTNSEIILPGKIISGTCSAITEKSIFIGQSVLNEYNISTNDAIGMNVQLSNNEVYNISCVYDDSESFAPEFIICVQNQSNMYGYMLCLQNAKDVLGIVKDLEKLGCNLYSHEREINEYVQFGENLSRGFLLLTIVVFAFSIMILASSLNQSFKEKYSFIAMLKAEGFFKNILFNFLCLESIIIWLAASIVVTPIYFGGLKVVKHILNRFNANFFEFLDFSSLLNANFIAFIGIILIMLFGSVIAGVLCVVKTDKMQVSDILCEEQ